MSKLETRVALINETGECANKLWPQLKALFEPFLGQQIFKADGTFMKKVSDKLEDFRRKTQTRNSFVYHWKSDHNLVFMVKNDKAFDGIAYYHEKSMYIGKIELGFLTSFMNQELYKTDYKAEDILKARKIYEELSKQLSEAESALYPFGTKD